jgi:hypothetical protein
MNVSLSMDDNVGFEVTRRIGATASFQPSFAPMSSFEPPSLSRFAPTVNTAPSKSVASAPRVRSRPSPVWKLQQVPVLPDFYPLDQAATLVPHASPMDVSGRVSEVLRDRSIEATYDDDKAKARCLTEDGVDFRVRLYRARGVYSHGIIVEVQRRSGSSVGFNQDVKAILDGAAGKVPPPPSLSSSGSTSSCNVLPLVSDSEDDDFETDGSSSLAMVSNMLKHSGYDAHSLAFQTLSSLTDPAKMGSSTARKVSLLLLQPDNAVGREVLSRVEMKKSDDEFNLRNLAFTILANAICNVQGKAVTGSLREHIRRILLQELLQAESSPRSAHMAARCIEYLIEGDHDLAAIHVALEKALEVGLARHAGLMRQAQKCLDQVSRVC